MPPAVVLQEQHDETEDAAATRRNKRLAQILQYIASINQTVVSGPESNQQHAFVREVARNSKPNGIVDVSDFFQRESSEDNGSSEPRKAPSSRVLFSSNDVRELVRLSSANRRPAKGVLGQPKSGDPEPSPSFSFYAALSSSSTTATGSHRKHLLSGAIKAAGLGSNKQQHHSEEVVDPTKPCWLRITRQASSIHHHPKGGYGPLPNSCSLPAVQQYLQEWQRNTSTPNATTTLSLDQFVWDHLDVAPKVPPTASRNDAQQIAIFLDECRGRVRQETALSRALEPLYNRLFEHQYNHTPDDVLVLGLGHARVLVTNSGDEGGATATDSTDDDERAPVKLVNGPLLEVLVEVELAPDGALLVRPREHTGVSLNRDVWGALGAHAATTGNTTTHSSSSSVWASWQRTVSELEPASLSPGQPATYVPLLQRLAVELSPDGIFRPSASGSTHSAHRLVITEAWCLYSRPKPSSVFARDALSFAEQLLKGRDGGGATAESRTAVVPPKATWSLTHGPGCLEQVLDREAREEERRKSPGLLESIHRWMTTKRTVHADDTVAPPSTLAVRTLFPLPSSDAQHRIADLLLSKQYPAVVCEGPPGTGKTHTIANLVCAYLCRGKRVLVTSKNAPALSVLRSRLPNGVQDLCVDVSRSELTGLRQLQKTVERLANRVSGTDATLEDEKCQQLQVREKLQFDWVQCCQQQTHTLCVWTAPVDSPLQKSMQELETEVQDIDAQLERLRQQIRTVLHNEKITDLSLRLLKDTPWLLKVLASWELKDLVVLSNRISGLLLPEGDPRLEVTGYTIPVDPILLQLCEVKAGSRFASVNHATVSVLASIPIVGQVSGLVQRLNGLHGDVSQLLINHQPPASNQDWQTVSSALKWVRGVDEFQRNTWQLLQRQHGWPSIDFLDTANTRVLHDSVTCAVELHQLLAHSEAYEAVAAATKCRAMDCRRSNISLQLRRLSEELVDATVISQLSRSFSPDAQSALIRFSQIAGKARFNKSSQPSKLSQRQKRRRQEYLDSFDTCCRYIPCWIMTASQISDYLPAECLFDLVIIDEASQSDVTVLPGMLRGEQWLIVGDSKQVSPSECFVSEDQLDILRAALPSSPLQGSFLPGQSFFDLCSQAFPRGRVSGTF